MNFIPFHCHTTFSLLDGLCKPDKLAKKCKEYGYEHVMITDHGNVSGAVKFAVEMQSLGLKPILGCEFYICEKDSTIKDEDNRKLHHLVVAAKNKQGWQKLMKAVSQSNHPDNFYYKPRLNMEKLANIIGDSCFVFSGHPGSYLWQKKTVSEIVDGINYLKSLFGNNVFLELQRFMNDEDVNLHIDLLKEAGKITNIKGLACLDIHYIEKQDAKLHRILLCSNLKKTLPEINRMKPEERPMSAFFNTDKFYLYSKEELKNFGHTEEELDFSEIINQYEEFKIKEQPRLPTFAENEFEVLRQECINGWKNKKISVKPNSKEYGDRVKLELDVMNKWNLSGYFLIVSDYIRWAKSKGMLVGPGRGCLFDTNIHTSDGYVDISEIGVNDYVFNYEGKLKRVVNKYDYDINETVMNIKTYHSDDSGVNLTLDHKVLCLRDSLNWVQAKYLQEDDFLYSSWIETKNHKYSLKIKNLKPKEGKIVYNNVHNMYEFKSDYERIFVNNTIPIDEIFADIMGALFFSKIETRKIICKESCLTENLKYFLFTHSIKYKKVNNNIEINSELLCSILRKLFRTEKKEEKLSIPKEISYSNESVINAFIKGIEKNFGKKEISHTNPFLIFDFKHLLLKVKKPSNITKKDDQYVISYDLLENENLKIFETGFASKIKTKETFNYKGKVYDFEIENTPNYGTSSFVVHNSSGGSLVAFLSGITEIDPIPYNLSFERFFNESRCSPDNISLPDIDTDFPSHMREDVINYLKEKYGHDKVCQIATFGTLKGKAALKEVFRILEVCDFDTINQITKNAPDEAEIADELEEQGEDSIINWCLVNDPKIFKDYCVLKDGKLEGEYADYFKLAIELEGVHKSQGKHAAGVIVSKDKLEDIAPIIYDKGEAVVALDKKDAEKIGLVKYDILGLSMLSKLMAVNNLLKYGTIYEKERS